MDFAKVGYAALCLTDRCNLRCRYCYMDKTAGRTMSFEAASRSLEFLLEQSTGKCIVTFFGGEPLLEFDLITRIVDHSRARNGNAIQFRMSTNGTLLDPARMDYLSDNEIFYVLSIDGIARQHDRNRIYPDGRGSFAEIDSKIGDILARNPYTIAVSVINPDTAHHASAGVMHLFERGFRYVLQTLDYPAEWTSRDLKILKSQYRDLAEFYCSRILGGSKIYFSPFDERILTRSHKPYGNGDLCDLANSQIAIAPSGALYPCVQFIGSDDSPSGGYSIGDVFSGFDASRREYFIEMNYREKESCSGCALKGRCATYCGCVNLRAAGAIDRVPAVLCEHERMLMPIVDRLANRLWSRNSSLFRRKFYDRAFPLTSYIEDCMIKNQGGG